MLLRGLLSLFLLLAPLRAADLQIYYTALQRVMAAQVFTQDGKLFIRGDAKNKCNFAYMENPVISANGPKLVINGRFSGRTARNLFGKCVGLGDSFSFSIAAIPFYQNGSVMLRDVKVDSLDKDGFYIRRVRTAIADSLSHQFAYNVAADAKRILEQKRDPLYAQELRGFNITGIRIAPDSIIVALDFQLAVR